MKLLQVVPDHGTRLYGAMIRKQAEIHRKGRGTFSRVRARKRNSARWTHVRYKGSISFEPGPLEAVEVTIQSPERGDEARLMSSFLGWLDRHFGEQLLSISIKYRRAAWDGRFWMQSGIEKFRRGASANAGPASLVLEFWNEIWRTAVARAV